MENNISRVRNTTRTTSRVKTVKKVLNRNKIEKQLTANNLAFYRSLNANEFERCVLKRDRWICKRCITQIEYHSLCIHLQNKYLYYKYHYKCNDNLT